MMHAPVTVGYVGVGSNLGDREATIRAAVDHLGRHQCIRIVALSSLIETEPVGPPQPKYLNGAVAIETSLTAQQLLGTLLEVERRLGRVRDPSERMGPRTIDLDLLMYGDQVIEEPGLSVPHPRMHERPFVLGPLAEIAPNAVNPRTGRTVALLARHLLQAQERSIVETRAPDRPEEVT
jgi:2-amino-4-hydroxy-6-hydroxymethyldihydropteridine diphosphokinase